MKKAKAKYDLLVNSDKRGAKSPVQEMIIALKAQVKELKDLKLSNQLINKLKQWQKGQGRQNQTNQHKGGVSQDQVKNTHRNQRDRSNKRFQQKDEEWKKIHPKDNRPKHTQ